MHFDLCRESCHKNKGIVVIILIELFANDLLDGAQPSDIEQKILPVLQGTIASWQLYP